MHRHKAFVCYSSRDRGPRLEAVLQFLQREQIEYWLDTEQIEPGKERDETYLDSRIREGLKDATVVLVLLTHNFQQYGPWAWREYTEIMTRQIASGRQVVVPVVFEETRILARFPPGLQADYRTDWSAGETGLRAILEQIGLPDGAARSEPLDLTQSSEPAEDVQRAVMFLNLAGALSDQSNFLAALPMIDSSARAAPWFPPEFALEAGQVFSRAGDYARADQSYHYAEERYQQAGVVPPPRLAMNRAIAFDQLSRYEEALAMLARAEQGHREAKEPVPHQIPQNRGAVLLRAHQPADALRAFTDALRINEQEGEPIDPAILGGIGGAHRVLGDPEALDWLNRSRDARKEQGLGGDPSLHQDRAQIFLTVGDVAQARAEVDAAQVLIREQGGRPHPDLIAVEGRVLLYENRPAEALAAFDRAAEMRTAGQFQPHPRYRIDRAIALLVLGQAQDAFDTLSALTLESATLRPDDRSALYELLGDAEAALDRRDAADDSYKTAVSIREESGILVPMPLMDKITENNRHRTRDVKRQARFERCFQALTQKDYRTAALALADAFEAERTIYEPDVDVLRRELVRNALGNQTDLRAVLLARHRDRRAVEEHLMSANRRPLGSRGGPMPDLAGMTSTAPPPELRRLREVLTAASPDPLTSPAELHLARALSHAWSGDRQQSQVAFEAALQAGLRDADDRIQRYVALEQSAIDAGVELDIQQLLSDVHRAALGDDVRKAKQLAGLVRAYTEYLNVPLGPMAERMIETQLNRAESPTS